MKTHKRATVLSHLGELLIEVLDGSDHEGVHEEREVGLHFGDVQQVLDVGEEIQDDDLALQRFSILVHLT